MALGFDHILVKLVVEPGVLDVHVSFSPQSTEILKHLMDTKTNPPSLGVYRMIVMHPHVYGL